MKNNIPKELRRSAGVYQILNTETGKSYVGSTTHFDQRLRNHRSDLRHGKKTNVKLLRAYLKYGFDVFEFNVLCVVNCDDLETKQSHINRLLEREGEFISQLKADGHATGYNVRANPATNAGTVLLRKKYFSGLIARTAVNHSTGSNHHRAVLNNTLVKEAKILKAKGYRSANIALYLNVHPSLLSSIFSESRPTWKHIQITQDEINTYVITDESKLLGYLLNRPQVVLIKYLISKEVCLTSIAQFVGIGLSAPKNIRRGIIYNHIFLSTSDVVDLEESGVYGLFEKFCQNKQVEYKNKLRKARRESSAFGKLSTKQVLEIKELLIKGESCVKIGSLFDITSDAIHKIKKGKSWTYLTGFNENTFREEAKLTDCIICGGKVLAKGYCGHHYHQLVTKARKHQ